MAETERTDDRDRDRDADTTREEEASAVFAASALRIGLALLGIVLLLFALGQAVGLDLLGWVADALSTRMGQWLVVAFFALLLIVVALRGVGRW